jgi:uncharacterized membrane protein HdeD (DUF308 family)
MNTLARNWWALSLRGVLAIAFGIIALMWPGLTLGVLILLFGVYAFVDGILAIVSAVRAARRHARWWPVAFEGMLGIAAGVIAFLVPRAAAWAVILTVSVWALITGVLEIVAAVRLRKLVRGEWMLGLSGLLSIIVGLLLLVWPATGLLALVWMLAFYAILYGALLLALSIRLRRSQREESVPSTTVGAGPVPQPV